MPRSGRHEGPPSSALADIPTNRIEPYPKKRPSKKPARKTDKENLNSNATSPPPSLSCYYDVVLEEVRGEVPCYDNAATVRRKLNKLIMDKAKIPAPGSKTFNKSSMAREMLELDRQDGSVHYEGLNAVGPTASALTKFFKKSGQIGGGDNPC
ncbi:MAG: hypothetical protein Q9190_001609 [Brigantiaea leucoxantha]